MSNSDEVTLLKRELLAQTQLREDAEAKLLAVASNVNSQIKNLREQRDSLKKGMSTMQKRYDEVIQERDHWRALAKKGE